MVPCHSRRCMDRTSHAYLPAAMPGVGLQSEECKMAPNVENVVHHHRDGARRSPQVYRPRVATFQLAWNLGHITLLLQIPAPHRPLVGEWGGAELGGGPMEHTSDGVRQKRSGDPSAQDNYDTQTD